MSAALRMPALDPERAAAIVEMVLACIHREYPVHQVHLVRGPDDVRLPRELNPAFYGAFDWHSSVHGHWTLARLARLMPGADFRPRALAALVQSLTGERLAGELAYLSGEGRQGFERPYGLAWLLQLIGELREWAGDDSCDTAGLEIVQDWLASLQPLEALAAERILALLERLPWPVRGGEHAQTAFSLGLTLDWARAAARDDVARAVTTRAREYYGEDRDAPIAYEPAGHDFLSPSLGEADLMRRVLDRGPFAAWLQSFLPDPGGAAARRWLTPVTSPDRADGKLSHLDGLNLSRAWMLEGIAGALGEAHSWHSSLAVAAHRHAVAGLASVPAGHYAGAHWLGSFAVYLLTRRGVVGGSATSP